MMVLRLLRRMLPVALKLALGSLMLFVGCWLVGRFWMNRSEPGTHATPPGRFLTVDERNVHVVERGQGPPVVLVHGLAGSSAEWPARLVGALAADHRTVAVDLLGMGFSDRDDSLVYDLSLWSEQLEGVLNELSIERADLVGRDVGAAVAATFAGRDPERVRRLVLVATRVPLASGDEPPRLWWLRLPGLGELMMGRSSGELRALRGAWDDTTEDTWTTPGTRTAILSAVRADIDPDVFGEALRAITAPTLVVHGRADVLVPFAAVSRWVPLIDGVIVQPLETIGHWPTDEAGEPVIELVTDFLRNH
jgi:pimeloyl-ACP methyl ester carboxylesterase